MPLPHSPEAQLDALGALLRQRKHTRVELLGRLLKPAAVLVPLFAREGELWTLLTLRRKELRAHAGQISFPGGGCDPADPDPQATALREAEEEVGIAAREVRILGPLDEYPTTTRYKISPFVGCIPYPHALALSPSEVAEVIEAPLRAFLEPGVFSEQKLPLPFPGLERFRTISVYQVGPHRIWGVTAAIMKQFLSLAAPVLESR